LIAGCLAHLDEVVLEVVDPPVELVPVVEFSVLLVVPPVPLPVPEPVPLVEPELVVAVGPEDDEVPEDVEPLLGDELPVSPPLVVPEPLEEAEGSVPVDDASVPEGSEPPFSAAARDDPGSTRPVEELSAELEESVVVLDAAPDERAPGASWCWLALPDVSWAADTGFAWLASEAPAADCALEASEGERPPSPASSVAALWAIAGRAWTGCAGGVEIATAPPAVATAAASSVAT
jgi:hypothetical protein